MITTIIKWPKFRRYLIIWGGFNALLAAIWWLADDDLNPMFHGFWVFVGLVAFLLGAKAQDDLS